MTDQDTNNNSSTPLRDNLVKTAVQFLQNPKVSASPLIHKQEFLRKKGLTEDEIQTACKLASIDKIVDQNTARNPHVSGYTTIPISSDHIYPYSRVNPYQEGLLYKVKEFFNTTALVGATVYCVYWFYKKFIEPFLFGPKKKDSTKESITELDKNVQNSLREVKESLLKVEGDVQKLTENRVIDPTVPQLVQELKQDLASLKSLLLSRKQFPSAPATIPSWQLDAGNTSQEKSSERDDAGSGSSTNNSDSSLEMIREDPSKWSQE